MTKDMLARKREANRRRRAAEDAAARHKRLASMRAYQATGAGKRAVFTAGLKSRYGISRAEYDAMLVAACGRCAACGDADDNRGNGLCLDHDHGTGDVRGLLCPRCNTALGHMRDSPLRIAKLAAYAAGCGRDL